VRLDPRRLVRSAIAAAIALSVACGSGSGSGAGGAAPAPPSEVPPPRTLVLYDDAGDWSWMGEVYAIQAGHLASHFGDWAAKPISRYEPGDLGRHALAVYVGSTWDQPLPAAFLDDVLAECAPVIWLGANVWQLAARAPDFAASYGFTPGLLETGAVARVRYKGQTLARDPANAAGILAPAVRDPAIAVELAAAVRGDGTSFPWALRARSLTYVGEIPFAYAGAGDRYLAFADLLFEALAPATPERHRALVRIEDVTPVESPEKIRAIADLLHGLGVPFSVAVVPIYVDALGAYSPTGLPEQVLLRDAPELVEALRYALARGGELVMHGTTHQHGVAANPYDGVSASDFEFWTAHVDPQDRVVLAGPVPGDSADWARERVELGLREFAAAGLPRPRVFEYPHYVGSAVDSAAIAALVPTAYHRGFYFAGTLGGEPDLARGFGQYFPYVVRDVYGWEVLPENLGNYQPVAYNAGVPVVLVDDLVAYARANRVVRDGFASFFFHPFFDVAILEEIVRGIQGEGYTFVSPRSL
jgi:uncharacterized protein YdaL